MHQGNGDLDGERRRQPRHVVRKLKVGHSDHDRDRYGQHSQNVGGFQSVQQAIFDGSIRYPINLSEIDRGTLSKIHLTHSAHPILFGVPPVLG